MQFFPGIPTKNSTNALSDDSIMEDLEEFGIRLNVTSNIRVDVYPSVASAKFIIKDNIRDSKLPTYN